MPRIQPIDLDQAQPKAKALLEGVHKSLGITPNIMATMAQSPATLEAYLGFGKALSGASISPQLREQIALTVAGENSCGYCASAHTAIGSKLGVNTDELAANLKGLSRNAKTEAALEFARQIVVERGWVSDDDLRNVREAGYTEGEITEIVATVAQNIFSNYFNHIADTDVDFPRVEVPEHQTA